MVITRLEERGWLVDVGGRAYLRKLRDDTPTSANVHVYATAVAERAALRAVQRATAESAGAQELLTNLEEPLARLRKLKPETAARDALQIEPVCSWAARPAPAPRDFIWGQIIPASRVTSFLGDGGFGKTTVAVQIGVHVSIGRPLYGLDVAGGTVLGIFCEDDQAELDRRVRAACAGEGLELSELDRFIALSRDGAENLLCTFDRDQIVFTHFYRQLEATLAALAPVRLLILDTLADLFGGDYLSTPHVRQFIKTGLNGLCVRHGCAVLLVAHPSASGISSGDGGGFSTAWNNSVRSRLYLRRPQTQDKDAAADRRVLEVRKANYGPSGIAIPLIWSAGAFVPDPAPIEDAAVSVRVPKVDTALAIAALEQFHTQAASGSVIGFATLMESLQASGSLQRGDYQTARKPLQRALKELERASLIVSSQVPRGYRLTETARGQRGHSGDNTGTAGTRGHGDNGDTPYRGVSPMSPPDVPRVVATRGGTSR
jgi:hypothetical protein